jgi:dienelactone hydrolase
MTVVVAVVILSLASPDFGGAARPFVGPRTEDITDAPAFEDGPWPVFEDSGTITMSSDNRVPVDVFYPGYDRYLDRIERDQAAPFPVIIFSPGFGAPARNYEDYLTMWASWGFVVAGVSWQYEDDRNRDVAYQDHDEVLTLLDNMASDWRSPFYNVPDTSTCGAVGHSRGGRAAFMSSSAESRIIAVSAWMPTLDNASEVRPSVSKLLFGGSDDDIAPPEVWLIPLYESSEEPIVYIELYDGDHSTERDLHPVITLDLFKYHLLGDRSVEGDIYGDDIKGRAEGGEFRLRMKLDGEVYDSVPPATNDPNVPDDGDLGGLGSAYVIAFILLLVATVVLVRYPGYRRILQALRVGKDT